LRSLRKDLYCGPLILPFYRGGRERAMQAGPSLYRRAGTLRNTSSLSDLGSAAGLDVDAFTRVSGRERTPVSRSFQTGVRGTLPGISGSLRTSRPAGAPGPVGRDGYKHPPPMGAKTLPVLRPFPGRSEHRAPLGRLDLLAAMAINIRPLWGQRPSPSSLPP
jgi:hypothetical protein